MSRLRITNPDLTLNDLMENWPETIPVFLKHKMLCVGCLINPFHTVADACAEYDMSEDEFLRELEQAVSVVG